MRTVRNPEYHEHAVPLSDWNQQPQWITSVNTHADRHTNSNKVILHPVPCFRLADRQWAHDHAHIYPFSFQHLYVPLAFNINSIRHPELLLRPNSVRHPIPTSLWNSHPDPFSVSHICVDTDALGDPNQQPHSRPVAVVDTHRNIHTHGHLCAIQNTFIHTDTHSACHTEWLTHTDLSPVRDRLLYLYHCFSNSVTHQFSLTHCHPDFLTHLLPDSLLRPISVVLHITLILSNQNADSECYLLHHSQSIMHAHILTHRNPYRNPHILAILIPNTHLLNTDTRVRHSDAQLQLFLNPDSLCHIQQGAVSITNRELLPLTLSQPKYSDNDTELHAHTDSFGQRFGYPKFCVAHVIHFVPPFRHGLPVAQCLWDTQHHEKSIIHCDRVCHPNRDPFLDCQRTADRQLISLILLHGDRQPHPNRTKPECFCFAFSKPL
mmetsp:Transcript_129901/g.224587  ORF Transcript_129901/g.224587 Transcript_129901/m.224587 type:complete len:434 (-) Transcript_129901:71-1372(-)